jgi:hypothetical protein
MLLDYEIGGSLVYDLIGVRNDVLFVEKALF